ncbi:MAG: type 2 isopentenyl-diphosphate Delta-isomerase [Syntrophomonas sp.]
MSSGFEDIHILHDSVPELDIEDIDISVAVLGKHLSAPLIINAITGGSEIGRRINRDLASLAAKYQIGMAVGSQTVALDEPGWIDTFSIVREVNPFGLIIANVGAASQKEHARRAVQMIGADALQLHFNVPQELAMAEGDRRFKGTIARLEETVQESPVPVIAKEVGFGFSRESAGRLYLAGISFFDSGGSGGTNFIRIEDRRYGLFNQELDNWGIPSAASMAEILSLEQPLTLIASGGVRSASDMAKTMALGANACGVAGWFLRILMEEGKESLDRLLGELVYRLKAILLMSGARTWEDLRRKPLLVTGRTAEWLRARNIVLRRKDPEGCWAFTIDSTSHAPGLR